MGTTEATQSTIERINLPQEIKYSITDFEFKETIGIGNFGNVVRVINKITNKEYAMKQVKKETILVMK